MEWIRGEYSKLIHFVTAQPDEVRKEQSKQGNEKLEGKEARTFYENLLNESIETSAEEKLEDSENKISSEDIIKVSRTKCKKRKPETESREDRHVSRKGRTINTDISELDINRFLRFSQEGNLQQLKLFLDKGVDINCQDQYGWTGLMCASYNGQMESVKYLLSIGARTDICDNNGQSAKDIANNARHKNVSKYIEKWEKGVKHPNDQEKPTLKSEQFYCPQCKSNFSDVTVKVHELSMVHLFNSKKRAKDDPFLLPSSNKGYKMMIQNGWDGRKGLGSEGQGQKYPVKTILKRDRKCLGSEREEKPKITHFNANETKAIQRNPERKLTKKVLNKRQQKAKEKKERQWERNLRYSMTDNFLHEQTQIK